MRAAFGPVKQELRIWREQGLVLPIWWRDDDATEPTPALDRLLGLAASLGAPLHLAVVPEPAGPDLAARLASTSAALVSRPARSAWAASAIVRGGMRDC